MRDRDQKSTIAAVKADVAESAALFFAPVIAVAREFGNAVHRYGRESKVTAGKTLLERKRNKSHQETTRGRAG